MKISIMTPEDLHPEQHAPLASKTGAPFTPHVPQLRMFAIASAVFALAAMLIDSAPAVFSLAVASILLGLFNVAAFPGERAFRGLAVLGIILGGFCALYAVLAFNGALPAAVLHG